MNRTMYQIDDCIYEGRSEQQLRMIVSYLMQALRIPDGDHLVLTFGTGRERNNRQALMYWVAQHLDEIDPDETEERLKKLAGSVVQTMEDQQWNA